MLYVKGERVEEREIRKAISEQDRKAKSFCSRKVGLIANI
jgi:hypothetical protein